ncbi:hypothetical protein CYY_003599 [Polysphondylium violaceum]|uniref:TATA-binding protein interacting (TIP20) domain-containing protein n=1 Tax=Polysphondylium violaceum TaxID=133409 RepID=A0A8J4PY58_9MYCE|nr:hypothetical protein CYY_003599 [Polysphondylium violaceum]
MSFFLGQILEKMGNRDKDIRFMATHDLANELEKEGFKMDPMFENKIVTKLLTLTDDSANNVQENVVKCLGLLIKKVKDTQALEIVNTLSDNILNSDSNKEELIEISGIGLKTIILNLPAESSPISNLIIKNLVPKLSTGIDNAKYNEKNEIKMSCLDILNDLLQKYGSSMVSDLENIQKIVLPKLSASRPAIRKRAIACLANVAAPAPDALFGSLVDYIIKSIEEAKKADIISTLVQCIASICKSSGYRLGKFLPKIVPHVASYCDNEKFEQNEELRENCLNCFEALVEQCPKDITPYLGQVIQLCVKYIKFDPNYEDEDDQDEEQDMDTEDDEEQEEDDEEADISDDDDISWKVRRSASKTLCAIILTRPELFIDLLTNVAPVLYARFKEREENVRLDIFATYVLLLKQFNRKQVDAKAKQILVDQVPKLVSSISKSLVDRSIRTRVGAFSLLKELIIVSPGALTNHVQQLMSGLSLCLGEKNNNSNLKIEALVFLKLLFASHPAKAFQPSCAVLADHIIKCIMDPYNRISSEALRVCQEFINVLNAVKADVDYKPIIDQLYEATFSQLKAQDIDQEVKESAISCMGSLITYFGDYLEAKIQPTLKILLERLDNEITRVVSVKVLTKIINSDIKIDVSSIIEKAIELLSTFLRKNNRILKQSSLVALNSIVKQIPNSLTNIKILPTIISEVCQLINEADLQLTHLSFNFIQQLLKANPKAASSVKDQFFPPTLVLLKSSLLQGVALESLLSLFGTVVQLNESGMKFDELLKLLIDTANQIKQPVTRQSYISISQCIAVITVQTTEAQRNSTVQNLIGNLSNANESLVLLSLSCLGEIGRRIDIHQNSTLLNAVYHTFDANNEEIKQVAALCLGDIAVCALAAYLPFILEQISSQPKKQYLLLHSLRETILKLSSTESGIKIIIPFLPQIVPLLFANCVNEEEGTRNIVAECLGKLSMIQPNDIIPKLIEKINASSPLERSTVVTSIKFSIMENKDLVDQHLAQHIDKFLTLLNDDNLIVKRSALLSLNYIAHNKPALIRGNLATYLPILYNNAKIKPELIREVDLGPFKHKVDDGIEIRKTAFECMYTLLDTSIDKIDVPAFINSLCDGLKDTQYDIKLLCHLMIIRLASCNGPALLEGLPQLIDPLKAILMTKVSETAVKQQIERNEECVRSALRAIAAIANIPNSESIAKFEEFLKSTIKTSALAAQYNSILAEEPNQADKMELLKKKKKNNKSKILLFF